MHDYDGSFYNRNEVYPYLGFDEFYESKDMEDVNYFGKYISDSTLNKNIIIQLEKNTSSPVFIWGLTMQNHTPYQTSNYTEGFDRIKIKSDNLTNEAYDKLLAYVNGIYESDLQLKQLIDYLEECKTPTVLMFFGDHFPSLYEVYYDTGMISTKVTSEWNKEEMFKMHTMPYFIYDNYSNKNVRHDNITGAVLLGNKLLNYIGIEKSSYFKFLDTLNYVALRDRLFIDKEGNLYDSIPNQCEEKSNEHKLLEYDMIYGNNYVREYENKKN
jgi:phosphoglycerol transferase MdoB-like AlkP superfamily enzyme